MKLRFFVTAAMLFMFSMGLSAQIQKTIPGEMTVLTGTVEAINASTRVVTFKDNKGQYEQVFMPGTSDLMTGMKIGDTITVRYYDNLIITAKAAGDSEVNTSEAAITPGSGTQTAGTAARQRTITATVDSIDASVPSVTVTGPNGWVYSARIQDKSILDTLKVGDRFDFTWTEAMLVSIE